MRGRFFMAFSLLAACGFAWAWDGDWTDGKSGQAYIYDPDNSTGRAGSDPPQTFLTPPDRDYRNADPKELDDYFAQRKKDYSPYALLRLTQALRYKATTLPPGYYQVKIGLLGEGSPQENEQSLENPVATLGPVLPPIQVTSAASTPSAEAPSQAGSQQSPKLKQIPSNKVPPQRVMIIKRLGNVVAVVPLHTVTIIKPARKEKIPKRALAWVEVENRQPVLKYYAKPWLFSTIFNAE